MKTTTLSLRRLKGRQPIVALTAYDAITARLASEAGVDLILVGDSVGNTLLGFESTIPVTLDMMVHHTAAVARGRPNGLVVADVPFAAAHFDFLQVLSACQRLMQEAGAEAVKIEGGTNLAPKIGQLVEAGVPVLGHIGLQPQQVFRIGKYRRFGVEPEEADSLLADALALESAGAFAVVGEMLESKLARTITETLKIPLIGIGSGPHCDGQVLVCTDVLGLTRGPVPSFVKVYAGLGEEIRRAFAAYAQDVRERRFPE